MKTKTTLPSKWIEHLQSIAETGMGYHIVDIGYPGGILKKQTILNSSILIYDNTKLLNIEDITYIKVSDEN